MVLFMIKVDVKFSFSIKFHFIDELWHTNTANGKAFEFVAEFGKRHAGSKCRIKILKVHC